MIGRKWPSIRGSRSSRFPVIGTFVCCVGVLVIAKSSAVQHLQQTEAERGAVWEQHQAFIKALRVEDIRLINETSGFNIVRPLEKTPEGFLKLTLRNDYNKGISAYQFKVGVTMTLVDHLGDPIQMMIQPGQIVERTAAVVRDPDATRVAVVVNAVVFDDGTSDGNPRWIQEIEDIRFGKGMQIEYFLSSLEKISRSQGIDTLRRLAELKADLLNDDNNLYGGLPVGIRSGRRQKGRELSRDYIDSFLSAAQTKSEEEHASMVGELLRHSETQFAALRSYIKMKKARLRN